MSVGHLSSLGEYLFRSSVYFLVMLSGLFLVLTCIHSLCALNIHPGLLFASIFFYPVGGLFILLIVSFTVQRLLVWCSLIWLFLLLFPLSEETLPKKYCRDWCQRASCLFFKEFYWFRSYIYVFDIFWVYFLNDVIR